MPQTLYQISKPEENNCVITTLPLVLYSDNRSQPQFKYVVDVYYAGDTTRLTRVKFANNDASNDGAGVIDLAPLVQPYLDYDQPWYTTASAFTQNVNAARFSFVCGEEYADTTSGSAILYDGDGSPGEPAYTASENNLNLAVQEFNDGYNWDFDSYNGFWMTNQTHTSSAFPKVVYNGDFETLTTMDNVSGSQSMKYNSIEIEVRSGSTILHYEDILSTQTSSADNENLLRYIGVGPQNLSNLNSNFSSSFASDWTTYKVFTDISINDLATDLFRTYYFENGGCTNYDKTRFAFINKLGTWDYYNIDLPLKKNTKLTKKTTNRTHLQYQSIAGTEGGGIPELNGSVYNRDDRGKDIYYTETKDEFIIDTDWLDDGQANWLTELFNSPDVYVQIGEHFQPINITSANYAWKVNKRKDKIFKYNIRYELANQRIARY